LRTDNPAAWTRKEASLPSVPAAAHLAAMPYQELPDFIRELRTKDGLAARALEFLILTGVRTGEAMGAEWSEFDLGARTWLIPGARMKKGREHRVPLSEPALAILDALPRVSDFVFPGAKHGQHFSNNAGRVLLNKMRPGVTAHGFRSTFRDWTEERTAFPHVVCEMSLAHSVGSVVERSYRRTDLFEKRRELMGAWASYCGTGNAATVART
jgi:integrase